VCSCETVDTWQLVPYCLEGLRCFEKLHEVTLLLILMD
jgi:hypothetical protein